MLAPIAYLLYIVLSLAMVITVGQLLYTNGKYFLRDVFADDPDLAGAVNRLLLVGFYLINIGFVLFTSSIGASVDDNSALAQTLSLKLGGVAVVLGTVHLINLSALNSARQRRRHEAARMTAPQYAPQYGPPAGG